jgi:maltooligosyltrehalose trehalohydrolase
MSRPLSRPLPHADSIRNEAKPPFRFGPLWTEDGATFRLWAPLVEDAALRLFGHGPDRPMQRRADGWHELHVPGAEAGTDYAFVLPGAHEEGERHVVPDPASRFQPQDVHGPSRLIDERAFAWTGAGWRPRPWHEAVFYQLHIGTFSPEGTFLGALERLDHIAELGVTAIQLLPLADFPGKFGWGYDGVCLFAPDAAYGEPDDLRAFIDAAHAHGLMVFADLVFNHFGPDGNYVPLYAPMLSEKHENDYGQVPNFDGAAAETVRAFVLENVRYWFECFHFDGARLDAIQAIADDSRPHLLEELAAMVHRDFPEHHLVVENSNNEAGWLARGADGSPRLFTAQWADDVHHTMHVIATGQLHDYYANYDRPIAQLGRALAEGFAYQGDHRPTDGCDLGEPSAHLPPTAFVAFAQNHDQIGNRPCGDRLNRTASPEAMLALSTVYLLAPSIPLVFMGEEFDATAPFPYFSDIAEELRDDMRASRAEKLEEWPVPSDPPDPFEDATFESARLDWRERELGRPILEHYRALIHLRRKEIAPRLEGIAGHAGRYSVLAGHVLEVEWRLGDGSRLRMLANLSAEPAEDFSPLWRGRLLWLTGAADADRIGGWSVMFSIEES